MGKNDLIIYWIYTPRYTPASSWKSVVFSGLFLLEGIALTGGFARESNTDNLSVHDQPTLTINLSYMDVEGDTGTSSST